MKKLIIILVVVVVTACSQSSDKPEKPLDSNEITGKWQLTETLADPGDGSGTWQPVDNGEILEFTADGTVFFSSDFCSGKEGDKASYDSKEKMISRTCEEKTFILSYDLNEGALFIYPHNPKCIEACGSKYEKIKN